MNEGFARGTLSVTQSQGVLSILPKGDKPREFLKNWRPIALLNTSYKLLSSCIANRLKSVLHFLIHENQKGFMKGRYIGENTRLIYDVLYETQNKKNPGILLLIDFEKAFDSVSWKFINNTLRFLNFGPDLIQWINVLNDNARLCVTQNGFLSQFFQIGRGCRQGDPVSSYIFNLCAEIMGLLIRQNKDIKGIQIGKEVKLLQYADDTVIFLDGSEKSLKSTLDLLFQFAKYSGLKPNISKTSAIWIGSKTKSNDMLCNEYNLHWENGPFTVLGIIFTADLKDIESHNFDNGLNKIMKEVNRWKKRNISPIGKITVIKSLLVPKLIHLFTVLPKPNLKWIKELESIFYKFIWQNKPEKISRKLLTQNYSNGGFRMVNISHFIKSLKVTWLRRLLSSECTWKKVFCHINNCDIKHICQFGSEYTNKKAKELTNPFWKEFFISITEFHDITQKHNNNLLEYPLWYNPNITIDNKTIFYGQFYDKGIHLLQDLLDDDCKFIKFEVLRDVHGINVPFTKFLGLKNSIFKTWPELKELESSHTVLPMIPEFIKNICKDSKGSRRIYDIYIKDKPVKNKIESKWQSILNLPENFTWNPFYKIVRKCTEDTRLIWFQSRIIYRILGTKKYLVKCKIKTNPTCSFCNLEEESIEHLFYHCSIVKQIWNELENWINTKCSLRLTLNITDIIFGKPGTENSVINLILLVVKYLLFSLSFNNKRPSIDQVKSYLHAYYLTEKMRFKINMKEEQFLKKWQTLCNLFV